MSVSINSRLRDWLYALIASPAERFLHYCARGYSDCALAVMPKISDFNNSHQSTAELICQHDLGDLVEPLVGAGWDPYQQATSGWNALTIAVATDALRVQQALHTAKIDPNVCNGGTRMTAAMYAARQGKEAALRLLVVHGANLDLQDKDGWTAAHWAAHKGQAKIILILCELGARLDIKDSWGQTHNEVTRDTPNPLKRAGF